MGAATVLVSPSIYQFDRNFELSRRTAAREATWEAATRTWVLRQGWTRELQGGETLTFQTFLEERTAGDPPAAYAAERRTPAEMRFRELQRYTRPLFLPVMALLALPFAFRVGKRGALAGIGVGLVLGMVFLISTSLFIKLGDVAALPPLLAAWSPHVLFTTLASFLLVRLRT